MTDFAIPPHLIEGLKRAPASFVEILEKVHRLLGDIADAAIEAADLLNGDTDLEADLGSDDDREQDDDFEGSTGIGTEGGRHGQDQDDEDGGDAEPDQDNEPSLGWTATGDPGGSNGPDLEPSLASTPAEDATGIYARNWVTDAEGEHDEDREPEHEAGDEALLVDVRP